MFHPSFRFIKMAYGLRGNIFLEVALLPHIEAATKSATSSISDDILDNVKELVRKLTSGCSLEIEVFPSDVNN